MSKSGRIMVAITGASGAIYAKRLLEILPEHYEKIYIVMSENARKIVEQELDAADLRLILPQSDKYSFYSPNDMFAPVASGSHDYDGLIVVPCSMGTLGRVAAGVSNDLVTRAADVCLKEKRQLIMVVREAPYNLIHLENMTKLAQAGATILPASPAFYNKPQSIDDLADFIVDRILSSIGIKSGLIEGWGE